VTGNALRSQTDGRRATVRDECPNDAVAREFARLGMGLFVLDPFLPSLFEQYCFEVVTEDGEIVFPSLAGSWTGFP
jgi:hypothetical protein